MKIKTEKYIIYRIGGQVYLREDESWFRDLTPEQIEIVNDMLPKGKSFLSTRTKRDIDRLIDTDFAEHESNSGLSIKDAMEKAGYKEDNSHRIETPQSDEYHTIEELYDHRAVIFLTLCRALQTINGFARRAKLHESMTTPVWRSKLHSDGTMYDDMFILGLNKEPGKQITYHLDMKYWDALESIEELEKAPEFDGHTSADVLERLKQL